MLILFHLVGILIFQILRNRKRLKSSENSGENGFEAVKNEEHDLESSLKFDPPVYRQRYAKVYETIIIEKWRNTIKKLADFGCAEFGLFVFLKNTNINEVVFADIDEDLLTYYKTKLYPLTVDHIRRRNEPFNIQVMCGSVAEPDESIKNCDMVTCIELIEHLYPDSLDALPYNIFSFIKPKIAIITTPNVEFNVLFNKLNKFRHYDHKFEWTREQFEDWCTNVTTRFPDYSVEFSGVGDVPTGSEMLGFCTQIATFVHKDFIDSISESLTVTTINQNTCCLCSDNNKCNNNSQNCNCTCFSCSPSGSYGVCTYNSLSINKNISSKESQSDKTFIKQPQHGTSESHSNYKLIERIEYPYDVDNRSEDEKTLDTFKYRINVFGGVNSRFFVDVRERCEIPVRDLMYGNIAVTEEEVSKLLAKNGYKLDDCVIQETGTCENCVIFYPSFNDMEEVSETSESSACETDNSKYQQNDECYSDWDEDYTKKENAKPTQALGQDTLPVENLSPQEVAQTSQEQDDKQPLDPLSDSGYQKSISILEDSPQTPVETPLELPLSNESSSTSSPIFPTCASSPENPLKSSNNSSKVPQKSPNGTSSKISPVTPPKTPPRTFSKTQSAKQLKDQLSDSKLASLMREKPLKSPTSTSHEKTPLISENLLKAQLIASKIRGSSSSNTPSSTPPQDELLEESLDLFEDIPINTPSLRGNDNRVHLKKAGKDKGDRTFPPVIPAVPPPIPPCLLPLEAGGRYKLNPDRVNELDRVNGRIGGNNQQQQFLKSEVMKMNSPIKDSAPGPSNVPRKRKKLKKPADLEDSSLDDAKSVANCILENSLNKIDVEDEAQRDEQQENQPQQLQEEERALIIELIVEPVVVENGDLANNNRDIEGNNFDAQDHPQQDPEDDFLNDNLPEIIPLLEDNLVIDNNNDVNPLPLAPEIQHEIVHEQPPNIAAHGGLPLPPPPVDRPRNEEEEKNEASADGGAPDGKNEAFALLGLQGMFSDVEPEENRDLFSGVSLEAVIDPNSERASLDSFDVDDNMMYTPRLQEEVFGLPRLEEEEVVDVPPVEEQEDVVHAAGNHLHIIDMGNVVLLGFRQNNSEGHGGLDTGVNHQAGFPDWLLQILSAHLEEDDEGSEGTNGLDEAHFYCQGDGLGVHPSVAVVEVDDDEDADVDTDNDTTDSSSNHTHTDFAEIGPCPSEEQDATSIQEGSQEDVTVNVSNLEDEPPSVNSQENVLSQKESEESHN